MGKKIIQTKQIKMGKNTEKNDNKNRTKKKVRIAQKEVGRVSTNIKPNEHILHKQPTPTQSNEEKRASMKTPKASQQQKTWSHAMQDFKSVNKRQKKKLTAEEKKKLRQKRKQQNKQHDKKEKKRSSVKNPISNLGDSFKLQTDPNSVRASIKMIQPDIIQNND